ncbi:flagellar hook protein FlgE [Hippea maritima]|uniref:Flagellar hook protein FlgE n=1 Tax=Hippea maritima (strain ATCC 700847 / DSM 10411 / MH2) TaxID=760142 RepID=F2LTI1_HIPMA|nr:flagellar hook-basal body complex protein [Hippea maritima]AEA33306.1 flagellar hook-basal body protein [Hippea maritima DSM 10411]
MIRALYTSSNGLFEQQLGVDSITNNIANVNTIGYKKTRPTFASLLYQTQKLGMPGENPMQIGLGVKLQSTDTIMSEGTLITGNKDTDLAIEGKGFFTLLDPSSKDSASYLFTRAGDFSFDADGNLVNPNGYMVVGWLAEQSQQGTGYYIPEDPTTGLPTGTIQPINISSYEDVPAVASTYIRFKANLNSSSKVDEYSPLKTSNDPTLRVNFNSVFNSNGELLNAQDGDNFQISYDGGTTWHTYEYDNDGNVSAGAEGFTTIDDLLSNMQSDVVADGITAEVSFEDGQVKIKNTGNNDISIRVRPTTEDPTFPTPQENQKLTTVFENLNQVVEPGETISSQNMETATHIVHSFFYDSTGDKHKIDVTFYRINQNQWAYEVSLPNNDGTVANNTGVVSFDKNGGLDVNTQSPTVNVTLNSGAPPTQLLINLWNTDSGGYEGNQFTGLTQFAMDSDTSFQDQDGSHSGILQKVFVDRDGNIMGTYSNGNSYSIAKLAISKFMNPQGLKREGKTMFKTTPNADSEDVLSSYGFIGVANEGGRGMILSNHLEASNVDLGEAFVNLIEYQRGFEANSKGVTTADQLLQTAIQLKR